MPLVSGEAANPKPRTMATRFGSTTMTAAIRRSVAKALHGLSDECSALATRLIENSAANEHNEARLRLRWATSVAVLVVGDASTYLAEKASP